MPPRPQVEPTHDWRQIELLARAPGQRTYELIRPVVLFGRSPAERAAKTGAAERPPSIAASTVGTGAASMAGRGVARLAAASVRAVPLPG